MANAKLKQLHQRITALEYSRSQPEDSRLQLWQRLIDWQQWRLSLNDPDNWQDDFSNLPLVHPLRELYNNLLWFECSYLPMFASIDVTWKAEKMKSCFAAFICGLMVDEGISAQELKRAEYMHQCVEITKQLLVDYDFSYLEQEMEKFHAAPPIVQRKEDKEMLVLSEESEKIFDDTWNKFHPMPEEQPPEEPRSNGTVFVKYIGKRADNSFSIETLTGKQRINRQGLYTISSQVYENLIKYEPTFWKKME